MSRVPDELDAGPVLLRRRAENDVAQLVEAMASSSAELAEWFPWAQRPFDLVEQRARVVASVDAFNSDRDYEFTLVERATGQFVGSLRLNPAAEARAAGIGYWVRTDRTRLGYATAAAKTATSAAFAFLPRVDRVVVHMDVANVKSAAVARKLGFALEREGELAIAAPARTGRGLFWVMSRQQWSTLVTES